MFLSFSFSFFLSFLFNFFQLLLLPPPSPLQLYPVHGDKELTLIDGISQLLTIFSMTFPKDPLAPKLEVLLEKLHAAFSKPGDPATLLLSFFNDALYKYPPLFSLRCLPFLLLNKTNKSIRLQ